MAIDIEELLKILPDLIKSNPKIKDAISDVLDSLVPRTTMAVFDSREISRVWGEGKANRIQ